MKLVKKEEIQTEDQEQTDWQEHYSKILNDEVLKIVSTELKARDSARDELKTAQEASARKLASINLKLSEAEKAHEAALSDGGENIDEAVETATMELMKIESLKKLKAKVQTGFPQLEERVREAQKRLVGPVHHAIINFRNDQINPEIRKVCEELLSRADSYHTAVMDLIKDLNVDVMGPTETAFHCSLRSELGFEIRLG